MQANPGYLTVTLQWTDVASVVWEYRYQSHADRTTWTVWQQSPNQGADAIVVVRNLTDKQPYTFEVRGVLNGVNGAVSSVDSTPLAQLPRVYRSVAYERGLKPGALDLEPNLSAGAIERARPMLLAEQRVTGTFSLIYLFNSKGMNLAQSDFTVTPTGAAAISNLQLVRTDPEGWDRWTVDVVPDADGDLTIGLNEHAVTEGNQPVEISFAVDLSADPRVGYMAFSSANALQSVNGPFTQGEPIDLTLHFSEQVTVSGSPSIKIQVVDSEVDAVYHSGSGTDSLVFRYTIVSGFPTAGTPQITSREIVMGSSSIMGARSKTANVKLPPVASSLELIVTDPPQGLQTGDAYEFLLTYSEVVTVAGRPFLRLKVSSDPTWSERAEYVGGSGSKTLIFRYVVPADHGLSEGTGLSLQEHLLYPDGAAIRSRAAAPVDAYPRLPSSLATYKLPAGGTVNLQYVSGSWPITDSAHDPKRPPVPSMEILLSVDKPTKIDISPKQFTLTYQDFEAGMKSTAFSVTATEHARVGDVVLLRFQINAENACCGYDGFFRSNWRALRIVAGPEEDEPEPEIVLRSEKLPLTRDLADTQLLCFPTRTLDDCKYESLYPRRGSLVAPSGFARSVLHTLDVLIADSAFEFYTVTETSDLSRWSSRFRRVPPGGELHYSEGEQHFGIQPGRAFFELRLWLIYPHPRRDTNSTRMGLGPFDPPLTVCFPRPGNLVGIPFLAAWEHEHLPWKERQWALLDGVPSSEPFQICAETRFATVFVLLHNDDPIAGLSELKFGRPIYWRALLPISASDLMAALPASVIVIGSEIDGETYYYLRPADGTPVPGFIDFAILPGQELFIFR
ncbi:MAG: hypothetical protein OXD50_16250 [Chloroflexi bacterium]|nr:hypothetical protein [Chloroflexota bacterium]